MDPKKRERLEEALVGVLGGRVSPPTRRRPVVDEAFLAEHRRRNAENRRFEKPTEKPAAEVGPRQSKRGSRDR